MSRIRPVTAAAVVLATLLAAVWHWRFRFHATPDTVSYLDIALQYAQGRWSQAVSPLWSPLYSWALLPLLKFFAHDRAAVLTGAHLLQAALVPASLWAALSLVALPARSAQDDGAVRASRWLVLGSALLASLCIVPVKYLTPDALALVLVLWLTARIMRETYFVGRRPACVLTGLLAGVVYLVRTFGAVYFALLVLLTFALRDPARPLKETLRRSVLYLAGFFAASSLWIVGLSAHEGHPTLGEAGRSNFLGASLILVPDVPDPAETGYVHGHALSFPAALPEHYAFSTEGRLKPLAKVPLLLMRLLALNVSALFFGYYPPDLPLFWPLGLLAAAAAWLFLPLKRPAGPPEAAAVFLVAASLGGFLIFVSSHVESRYVAPFFVILSAGLVLKVRSLSEPRRSILSGILASLGVLFFLFPFFAYVNQLRDDEPAAAAAQTRLAEWMHSGPGRYATVGAGYDLGMSAWLSNSEIVASVDPQGLTGAHCGQVVQKLDALDVSIVLASAPSPGCGEWSQVPGTAWYYWRRVGPAHR